MYGAKTKGQPRLLNLHRKPGQPKKRRKITLVFDENKRREYLTGFRKRKLQRQQRAQEELNKKFKEEKKRIKQEAREQFKKYLSTREVPELQQLLSEREYETEGHTVSILELNVADLEEGSTMIGENSGPAEDESEEEEDEENENNTECSDEVVGMSLDETKQGTKPKKAPKGPEAEITNKQDLKKVIRKAALRQVKNSKVFQQKQRIERHKNKKKSKRKMEKIQAVKSKAKNKGGKHKRK